MDLGPTQVRSNGDGIGPWASLPQAHSCLFQWGPAPHPAGLAGPATAASTARHRHDQASTPRARVLSLVRHRGGGGAGSFRRGTDGAAERGRRRRRRTRGNGRARGSGGGPAAPYRWSRAVARSPAAWMRLGVGGLLVGSIIFAFYEWGLPLLSEKVLLPIMRWEARSFGRHLLAIVLIASLAIFPVVLLPSSPSMWLTGIIFGYGFGFLIIMVGTAIGMSIPYFIGSLFRERLHEWLEKKWPREIALVKLASKGSWFKQFRVIVLLRISPFPYSMLNYTVTVTQIKYGPYICGSVVGMVPDALVNIYSGRLILTLAGLKYHNHRLTTVEIVYNVISITVAFLVAIGFTVYAKRALDEMERSEGTCPEPAGIAHGSTELRAHHQECSNSSSVPIDVVYTVYSDDSLARHVLDLLPESLHGFGYNGEK
uniref:VTT domain-containing protein n=1 Tax=Oryza rufipogon TaxID=4529 RepID=A0A0E0QBP6_ORYRU